MYLHALKTEKTKNLNEKSAYEYFNELSHYVSSILEYLIYKFLIN